MKLGVSIGAAPTSAGAIAGLRLATEAAKAGHGAFVYLIGDGAGLVSGQEAALASFISAGGKLFICAYSCQKRGLPSAGVPEATYCGLVVLSDILKSCDRFVAFN